MEEGIQNAFHLIETENNQDKCHTKLESPKGESRILQINSKTHKPTQRPFLSLYLNLLHEPSSPLIPVETGLWLNIHCLQKNRSFLPENASNASFDRSSGSAFKSLVS